MFERSLTKIYVQGVYMKAQHFLSLVCFGVSLSSILLLSTDALAKRNSNYNQEAIQQENLPYTTRQEVARNGTPAKNTNVSHYAPIYETTQDLNHDLPVSIDDGVISDNSKFSLSEHQAAGILKTVNQAEISASKIAEKKAANLQVRDFASRMISEHKKNKTEARKLLGKLGLGAERSHVAEIFRDDARQNLRELKKLEGAAFDESYMTGQIEMHKALITDIDQRLIPAASKPELIEFLKTTRDHVKHHLADAQDIQNNLGTIIK